MSQQRNAACNCGSGKKYKHCCALKESAASVAPPAVEMGQLAELFRLGRHSELEQRALAMLVRFPAAGFLWQLLGAVQSQQGKDSLRAFRRSAELLPADAGAQSNLGTALAAADLHQDAIASYQRAIVINPTFGDAYFNLANSQGRVGELTEAVSNYRRAIDAKPGFSEACNSLGLALQQLQQLPEALASFREAIRCKPGNVKAHFNLANALEKTGEIDAAMQSLCEAIAINPHFANGHGRLAEMLSGQGRYLEALEYLQRACEQEPQSAVRHFNLGVAFQMIERFDEAMRCYQISLQWQPDLAEANNNLGVCLQNQGQIDEAMNACRRALDLRPDFAMAHNNLGLFCKDVGQLDDAITSYRRAVALDPQYTQAHSNLVYLLSFHPDYDQASICDEAKRFGLAHNVDSRQLDTAHNMASESPSRRLRIGYVSPDFREHCQSFFTVPLLSNHDRSQVEVVCYADLARPDDITARLQGYADVWRTTHLQSDAAVAAMVVRDRIDILVDLTMHMSKGRPHLFAMNPAPIQVAWLAYPGTTGIAAMDYRFTDPWLDPDDGNDADYTEASIRLRDSFWCYDPLNNELKPNGLPALVNGHITFGCLNNFCKVTDDTLRCWGQIMAQTPASRLLLLAGKGPQHRKRVCDLLAIAGVTPDRVEFVEHQLRPDYLKTYHRIDLCLDTLPYNGHTTSLDSLWMGVPVVSQVGHTVVGRAGWSQSNNLGHPELVAFNECDFIALASALASDRDRLEKLRATLREKLEASPLMDGKRFAAAMEAGYRQAWLAAIETAARTPV
ncbi:protein O-GlcNAc transferase [Actimicrobium sp. GrIS 1.19]|uniref:O-linked N-acetylglucosamine transferase family protein n=1 Tax=Actimicrobium sp. GrIS 1.19 TaxID=3071708 RepID=UPI002DFB8634|nr:protein O-GlcNAc transferase [Actimicrobium sp. GrIS 1.19]